MEIIEWFWAAFEKRAIASIQMESTRYLFGSLGVFLLIWIIFERPLKGRKIRKPTPRTRQIRRELMFSASTIFVFLIMNIFVFEGAAGGIFKFYTDIEQYGWAYLWGSIFFLMIFHDAYFYWTHRLMHHPKLFRWVHATHHRSHNPTPFTAYSFDPLEAAVNFSVIPVYALFVPVHDMAVLYYLWIMIFRNALAHCGYELMPRGWARHPILGQLTSITHHDMHHEKMTGNYGFYFTFWDRLMGTEHKNYLERMDRITAPKKPLTNEGAIIAQPGLTPISD